MKTIASIALCITFAAPGAAQQAPPPNPLGQSLLDVVGNVREDACIHIPLRPEDARY